MLSSCSNERRAEAIAAQYDVIIVGAGPAGSTAAQYASQGGAKTLVLEKHHRIGSPLCCAEAISLTGLNRVIEPDPKWISSKVERAVLVAPDGVQTRVNHPKAGYVLDRRLFDQDLAGKAESAGAEIMTGADVRELIFTKAGKIAGVWAEIDGSRQEFLGKVLIAADGVESEIAIKAGLNSHLKPAHIHSACQYLLDDIDIEPATIEFHFGNQIAPGGYIWVFTKGQRKANAGIGICPTKSPRKKALAYLDEFIERRFSKYKIIERMTGGVPSYMAGLPLYKDNLLLVGDAGRVVDSLTGAGIANALLSGKIGGITAANMIKNGVSADMYAREFLQLKQKELKFYYYCREIFLKMTDDDFKSVLRFTEDLFGEKDVTAINPFEVVKKILLAHPRLLKLGRHLVF